MPTLLSRLLQPRPGSDRREAAPVSTAGRLIYAVGDVHGRLDLLQPLIDRIRADARSVPVNQPPVLVFLGDYIDRGRDSKGVIEAVIALRDEGFFEVWALKGNHEEALLTFLEDAGFGPTWCAHGGAETLASYGVTPPVRADEAHWRAAQTAFAQALAGRRLEFFKGLGLTAVFGDYVFVHAGLRPGVSLADQDEHDLLWIRGDFITAANGRGSWRGDGAARIVVHGHTPETEVFLGQRRIGVDTGAYATGVLSAVRLEGPDRQVIQSRG